MNDFNRKYEWNRDIYTDIHTIFFKFIKLISKGFVKIICMFCKILEEQIACPMVLLEADLTALLRGWGHFPVTAHSFWTRMVRKADCKDFFLYILNNLMRICLQFFLMQVLIQTHRPIGPRSTMSHVIKTN